MKWFWKKLCLFSYRRWRGVMKEMPVGVPGNRDPEFRCDHYEPGPRGGFDCESDGHYLCKKCSHYRPEGYFDLDSEDYSNIHAGD